MVTISSTMIALSPRRKAGDQVRGCRITVIPRFVTGSYVA